MVQEAMCRIYLPSALLYTLASWYPRSCRLPRFGRLSGQLAATSRTMVSVTVMHPFPGG